MDLELKNQILQSEAEDIARAFILSYCRLKEVPTALEYLVPLMAQEDKNKQGSEGLNARSVSGISETYLNGYSENVMKILKKYRKIVVV